MAKKIRGNSVNPDRHVYDFYPTDPKWTRALQRHVDLGDYVWEPAAGQGDMVDALVAESISATDIDSDMPVDFLSDQAVEFAQLLPDDVSIVTNPPYKHFDDFIEQALKLTRGVVAMLGNMQALGGVNRTSKIWLPKPPSQVIVIPQRMVVNDSPSQFCHAWFVWNTTPPPTRITWDDLTEGALF
jgi:hypothetical protein